MWMEKVVKEDKVAKEEKVAMLSEKMPRLLQDSTSSA